MNTNTIKIGLLTEDIKQLMRVDGQEQYDMMRLCSDHSNPYLLADKKPVLHNIGQDQLILIFDFGKTHFFLTPDQVYRLGVFMELSIYQIIALMLKSEWELFLAESFGYEHEPAPDLKALLLDKMQMEKHILKFQPDTSRIYKLIRDLPFAKASQKARANMNLVVHEMLRERYFLLDHREIIALYPEKESNESLLLKNASEAQALEYSKLKYLWKRRTTDLEELLLEGERKKRSNQNLEDLYFRTFGKLELNKQALEFDVKKYKKVLLLKSQDPQLTYKEAIRQTVESLSDLAEKSRELKNTFMRSLSLITNTESGGFVQLPAAQLARYQEEVKELLKLLLFLLHSDTCPVKNLSTNQKTGVNELWLELMSSKDEIFSYTPGTLLYSLPDINRLYSILTRACKILGVNMEDLEQGDRLDFMIRKGNSIAEIVSFLKHDIKQLQLHLTNLEIVQDEFTNERKCYLYRDALENKEDHKKFLNNRIIELSEKISGLKNEITRAFNKSRSKNNLEHIPESKN